MKNSIKIFIYELYDNIILIYNTNTFLFFETAADNLLESFYNTRPVSKAAWMVEMEMEQSEICFARNT